MGLLQALLFGALLFWSGCGESLIQFLDLGTDQAAVSDPDLSYEEEGSSGANGGGNLPLGFYERGCQWDAPCGDGLSTKDPKSNPQR